MSSFTPLIFLFHVSVYNGFYAKYYQDGEEVYVIHQTDDECTLSEFFHGNKAGVKLLFDEKEVGVCNRNINNKCEKNRSGILK